MLNKDKLEDYLNRCLMTGAEFAEIYEEKIDKCVYEYIDSKLNDISNMDDYGVGIRIKLGDNVVYGYVNVVDDEHIYRKIDELSSGFDGDRVVSDVKLVQEDVRVINPIRIWPRDYGEDNKVNLLKRVDSCIRSQDKRIVQVESILMEDERHVVIANSDGKYVCDDRLHLRLFDTVTVEENGKRKRMHESFGKCMGYEMFDEFDVSGFASSLVKSAILKLKAVACPGGEMPVILGPGFCGTIIHEAVGHTLEATSVGIGNSIMCGKLGVKLGRDVLTLIDDGSIGNEWGSSNIDDEGNVPRRNVLIDKGVISGYLVDMFNSKRMGMSSNGCGRREGYYYAPTSRMSNTFIAPGSDKLEDMIASIKNGLFVRSMNGGTVKPETGDFNFNCDSVCMIRDGKLAEEVDDVMLIGNAVSILKNISMVSDEVALESGHCGSLSGNIYVTVGEPYIKVDKVMVGGSDV